jgi:N-acetylglucosaminyldiphosphoundecaprenol N-acetyl-beta-D-mannosaminyltransferase
MEYLSFVDFYGLRIVKSEKAAVLKAFHRVLEMDGNLRVTTMNAQIAYYYLTMPAYQAALNDSLVVPDGVGLSWAVKKRMNTRINRFPGVELGIELCRIAAESGKTVFLYGSKPGVAEKAAAFLERETGVRIVGCRHGFNDSDEETQYGICRKISESGASILFVALGAPKQEIWLEKYFEKTNARIGIGVGGSLDVWAGVVKRAPAWIQRMNLEWLYRILKSPRKKFKVIFQLLKFISIVNSDGIDGSREEKRRYE